MPEKNSAIEKEPNTSFQQKAPKQSTHETYQKKLEELVTMKYNLLVDFLEKTETGKIIKKMLAADGIEKCTRYELRFIFSRIEQHLYNEKNLSDKPEVKIFEAETEKIDKLIEQEIVEHYKKK